MRRFTRPMPSYVYGWQQYIRIGNYIAKLTTYVIRWWVILEGSRIDSYMIRVKS